MFTDSVQDAAHRAGFVQARSHSLTLRTALRSALGDGELDLDRAQPGRDRPRRQRPDAALPAARPRHRRPRRVRRVLAARRPPQRRAAPRRTRPSGGCSSTSTWSSACSPAPAAPWNSPAASPPRSTSARPQQAPSSAGRRSSAPTPAQLPTDRGVRPARWPAGCAAPSNGSAPRAASTTSGCDRYIDEERQPLAVWGGRPRGQGMPAFPKGRPAPAFPALKSGPATLPEGFDPITAPHVLVRPLDVALPGVSPQDGAFLAKALFAALADQTTADDPHHRNRLHRLRLAPGHRAGQRARPSRRCSDKRHLLVCDGLPDPGARERRPSSTNSTAPPASWSAARDGCSRTPQGRQLLPHLYDSTRDEARRGPRTHRCCRRRPARLRDRVQARRHRPAGTQCPGRHPHAGDGHRHRRPVHRHARLAAPRRCRPTCNASAAPAGSPATRWSSPSSGAAASTCPNCSNRCPSSRARSGRPRRSSTPRRSCSASTSPTSRTASPATRGADPPIDARPVLGSDRRGQLAGATARVRRRRQRRATRPISSASSASISRGPSPRLRAWASATPEGGAPAGCAPADGREPRWRPDLDELNTTAHRRRRADLPEFERRGRVAGGHRRRPARATRSPSGSTRNCSARRSTR